MVSAAHMQCRTGGSCRLWSWRELYARREPAQCGLAVFAEVHLVASRNIALRSGLAAWRLWRCLGGCRDTPRSGAPRASGNTCGHRGVGFVRRHRSCLFQPAVAGPMPFLATVVAHVSLLGLALGTCRGTLSGLVLFVPGGTNRSLLSD